MNESLTEFKAWCREAFEFLVRDFGFHELSELHPNHTNNYQARFSNEQVEILVLGEGYGTVASVNYVTSKGTEVPTEILDPNWEPFIGRKKTKKGKAPTDSQHDQIFAAARRIQERDSDILQGSMFRLEKAATRWRTIHEKMGWK